MRLARFAASMVSAALACEARGSPSRFSAGNEASAPTQPAPRLFFVQAPDGSVDRIVRDAVAGAAGDHRRVVVYVGASWCEPCERFHRAVERGDLDTVFPDLTLLAFDADRDGSRLRAAGYGSTYIPLFVRPGSDGRASSEKIEGGIKGDGAVAQLVPRLKDLLAR
ncbi:MAG: thioredoxin family protein [Polyangiaceae bacterium]